MLEVYEPWKNNHKIITVAHKRTYKTDFQMKVSKTEKSASTINNFNALYQIETSAK